MGKQYRIRLDDQDRHTIVEALADHLTRRVRRASRTCDIGTEASLLMRLAKPKAARPDRAWFAYHWKTCDKHIIYGRIKELVESSKGTVK